MTAADALIEFAGVSKDYGGAAPLRVASLRIAPEDALVVAGLDRAAAETFMHLVSGAAVPDAGRVLVAGADTREIATDTEWLLSLDRFGFVSHRAVLLGTLSTAANLALPMTVAIEPLSAEMQRRVEALADEVRLPRARLVVPCDALAPAERLRLHLARALASNPQLLLLEHPTIELQDEPARAAIGETVREIARARRLAWFGLSDDRVFARASGGRRLRLDGTGTLVRESWSPFR
jgi:ABC-type ATPase involved in cell division